MSLIVGLLTGVLVVDSLLLTLLILIQLPKKESGSGLAFGAGATDALFGAGSGSALTQITKYAAGFFLCLSLFLSVIGAHSSKNADRGIQDEIRKQAAESAVPAAAPSSTDPDAATTTPIVPQAGDSDLRAPESGSGTPPPAPAAPGNDG